ncbi:MAG: hypothetical protein JWM81_1006 [Candidatus Saccharibacteria bacterium]|nr:hypothetical protein [Candidatus Saccharibacteria bacterium]
MYRVEFFESLTAYEIRDPLALACESVARAIGIYARFEQPQQVAFTSPVYGPNGRQAKRERIGNGNHKAWLVYFQTEPPQTSRPTVESAIALRSLVDPAKKQYGGFDYGVYGETSPRYSYVDLLTPSEAGMWRPADPSEEFLNAIHEAVEAAFDTGQERLF